MKKLLTVLLFVALLIPIGFYLFTFLQYFFISNVEQENWLKAIRYRKIAGVVTNVLINTGDKNNLGGLEIKDIENGNLFTGVHFFKRQNIDVLKFVEKGDSIYKDANSESVTIVKRETKLQKEFPNFFK